MMDRHSALYTDLKTKHAKQQVFSFKTQDLVALQGSDPKAQKLSRFMKGKSKNVCSAPLGGSPNYNKAARALNFYLKQQ